MSKQMNIKSERVRNDLIAVRVGLDGRRATIDRGALEQDDFRSNRPEI